MKKKQCNSMIPKEKKTEEMNPTFILAFWTLSRKQDIDLCSIWQSWKGLDWNFNRHKRMEFVGQDIGGKGGCPKVFLGNSMKGAMHCLCAEGYCVKPIRGLWLQAKSSMEEVPEVLPVKDTGVPAQQIGETSLDHVRHSLEMSARLTLYEKKTIF